MRRAALLITICMGCGVDLPFPDNVTCVSDADCRDSVCYDGHCVDSTTIDATPPRLVLVSVASPQALVLTFDERLAPDTVTALTHYVATPALTFTNAAIGSEGQTVVLSVETQEAGAAYSLDVNAIADLSGNIITPPENHGTFTGAGRTADTLAPVTLEPPNDARLFGSLGVTFAWTARVGAQRYSVEVATDPELTLPVPGSPFIVTGSAGTDPTTTLSLQLPSAAQYYWRVGSDIAARDGETATFSVIGDRLHVYCPPQEECGTGGNGTVRSPFRSVAQALSDAKLHGVPRIAIAARGDGSVYEELLILQAGIDIHGGYTPSFEESSRDSVANATIIRGPSAYTVYGENIFGPLIVEGLHFRAGAAPTTHVVQLDRVRNVTFRDITIDADPSAPPAQEWIGVQIIDSWNGCGSRYPTCDGDIDCPLFCTEQSLTFERPTIRVPSALDLAAGMYSSKGDVEIDGGIITVADMPQRSLGLEAPGGSVSYGVRFNVQSIIRNSRIVTGAADFTYAVAQANQNFASVGTIERNTIRAGDATYRSAGAWIESLTGLILTNNDIQSGRATFSYGVHLTVANNLVNIASNNTIGSGPIRVQLGLTPQSNAFDSARTYVLANNILFVRGVTTSNGRCARTLDYPGRIENNLFFGCPTLWADVTGDLNDVNSYAALNGWSADFGFCANNEVGADPSTTFASFDGDDMHLSPAAAPNIRTGGVATSALPYGRVTIDHDNLTRTCTGVDACFSRGAYELD